jgi:phosphoglycerate dehydrogenase-like enzyme
MKIGSLMPAGSRLWAERLAALGARFPDHELVLDPARVAAEPASFDAVLASKADPAFIEAATSLKALFLGITGVDKLPLGLLASRGVRLYNVHGNAESVAQCALAMALAFYGRVIEYHDDLKKTVWHGFWVGKGAEDEWSSIFRRKCAIFGTGAIGQALAKLLKAFDCEVTGYRRNSEGALPPCFDRIEPDFRRAVEGSELLFVTLPLSPETEGLFSKELLLSAKGKFLVNVGRGPVVDEEGLYLALRDGVLKGAAIDTWYRYPQAGATSGAPSRFPIHELPNVILSPHIGGSTREANLIAADQAMANIAEWLETGRCRREVDLARRY